MSPDHHGLPHSNLGRFTDWAPAKPPQRRLRRCRLFSSSLDYNAAVKTVNRERHEFQERILRCVTIMTCAIDESAAVQPVADPGICQLLTLESSRQCGRTFGRASRQTREADESGPLLLPIRLRLPRPLAFVRRVSQALRSCLHYIGSAKNGQPKEAGGRRPTGTVEAPRSSPIRAPARAGDGIRTRDTQLGKLGNWQC